MYTVYPIEPLARASCAIDLDAIRRIALRAPMLGDPLNMTAATLHGRLDRLLEQTSLNRVLVVAHALSEIARRDASAAAVFKAAGLAGQIRTEVEARKAAALTEFSAPVVPAVAPSPSANAAHLS
jgi:predicted transcriptional regulator